MKQLKKMEEKERSGIDKKNLFCAPRNNTVLGFKSGPREPDSPQWVQTGLTQDGRGETLLLGRRGDCRNTLEGMTAEAELNDRWLYRRTAEDACRDRGQMS